MRTLKLMFGPILVVAIVAGAVAAAGGDDRTPPTATSPAAATAAPGPDAFAVFRRPAGPADRMPAAIREQLAPATAGAAIDFDGARAVAAAGTGAVWAIPGPTQICLAQPDPIDGFAVTCASVQRALQGGLWVGLNGLPGQEAGDVGLAILVPDGVASVTAVATDGTRQAIAVDDNVAFADLSASRSVAFDDLDGTHTVAVPGTPAALVAR